MRLWSRIVNVSRSALPAGGPIKSEISVLSKCAASALVRLHQRCRRLRTGVNPFYRTRVIGRFPWPSYMPPQIQKEVDSLNSSVTVWYCRHPQ